MAIGVFRRLGFWYHLSRARAAARAGNWGEAARKYRSLVQSAQRTPNIWMQYGHALREAGDPAAAEIAYSHVLTLYDTRAEAHLQLGHILRERGQDTDAAQNYADALWLNRNMDEARLAIEKLGYSDKFAERGFKEDTTAIDELRLGLDLNDASVDKLSRRVEILAGTILGTVERSDNFDARIRDLFQQMADLLDHVSVARAQGYELLRQKNSLNQLMLDIQGLARSLEQLAPRIQAVEEVQGNSARYAALEKAIAAHGAALAALDAETKAAKEMVPAVLEARMEELSHRMNASPATSDLTTAISELQQREQRDAQMLEYLVNRIEFVRRELMFEYRYNKSGNDFGESLAVEAQIINGDKIEEARGKRDIRLNVGCGHIQAEGYINVDRRHLPGVDVLADADRLPFGEEEVAEISSSHMLEHFPQESLVRDLLPYWKSLLQAGGRLHAIIPDGETMLIKHVNEDYPFSHLREVLFGAQDYSGDFHYNLLTPSSLSQILRDQGFVDVRVIEAGRRNGLCYEFEIEAFKGSAQA